MNSSGFSCVKAVVQVYQNYSEITYDLYMDVEFDF